MARALYKNFDLRPIDGIDSWSSTATVAAAKRQGEAVPSRLVPVPVARDDVSRPLLLLPGRIGFTCSMRQVALC